MEGLINSRLASLFSNAHIISYLEHKLARNVQRKLVISIIPLTRRSLECFRRWI